MSEAPKLKPCPFCGAEAEYNEGRTGDGRPWNYYACSDCEAMQPYVSSAQKSQFDESYNQALDAEAWNTRTDAFTPAHAAKVLLDAEVGLIAEKAMAEERDRFTEGLRGQFLAALRAIAQETTDQARNPSEGEG